MGAFGLLPDRGDTCLSFYLENDLFAGTDKNYTTVWISPTRDCHRQLIPINPLRRSAGKLVCGLYMACSARVAPLCHMTSPLTARCSAASIPASPENLSSV